MNTLSSTTGPPWFDDWPEFTSLREDLPGTPDICVAVLDGPVDLTHPTFGTLSLRVLPSVSAADFETQITSMAHGTAVASIVFGIASGCRALLIPVLEDQSDASGAICSQLDLARGITLAVEAGAHILNVSAGELSREGSAHPLLTDAVRFAASRRVLIVASAGNDGCDCVHVPAVLASVLAVGAMDAQGHPLASSNWGKGYQTNGILARGQDVPAAVPGGGFDLRSGTSYASAIVSGVAALLLTARLRCGGIIDPLEIGSIITSTASRSAIKQTHRHRYLRGRLDIKESLKGVRTVSSDIDAKDSVKGEVEAAVSSASESSAETRGAVNCGCGCANGGCSCTFGENRMPEMRAGQLVYGLGTLGCDFGTEARRDSFREQMGPSASPYDPEQFLAFLEKNPWDAQAVHWTLNLDTTPIYLIQPRGAFAAVAYERLRVFLREQIDGKIERVSVPGTIIGRGRLASGQVLPAIWPDLRGMYSWNTKSLMSVLGEHDEDARKNSLEGFLDRIYYGLRNLGLSSPDRALNYAATNAMNVAHVFESVAKEDMRFDAILVERSPVCRPESDCWDVILMFFDSERQTQRARRAYRFTVDVSDICPVMVGPVRSWPVR